MGTGTSNMVVLLLRDELRLWSPNKPEEDRGKVRD